MQIPFARDDRRRGLAMVAAFLTAFLTPPGVLAVFDQIALMCPQFPYLSGAWARAYAAGRPGPANSNLPAA